eukprot:1638294-Pleurochrysis_carterae.AAC.1
MSDLTSCPVFLLRPLAGGDGCCRSDEHPTGGDGTGGVFVRGLALHGAHWAACRGVRAGQGRPGAADASGGGETGADGAPPVSGGVACVRAWSVLPPVWLQRVGTGTACEMQSCACHGNAGSVRRIALPLYAGHPSDVVAEAAVRPVCHLLLDCACPNRSLRQCFFALV